MAYSIFYDLETSDRHTIGQFINFAFIALDEKWKEVGKLTGNVKINRLQLPSASAILANRCNVIEHQKTAEFTEFQACHAINDFFVEIRNMTKDKVNLIGFNSNSFDLPYLRTVLFRNGFNAYGYDLLNKDLLLSAQKIFIANPNFIDLCFDQEKNSISLRLENLTRKFGFLTGKQAHESLADVKLTVDLAMHFKEEFGVDVRTYNPYEVKKKMKVGDLACRMELMYSSKIPVRIRLIPMALLYEDFGASLWIDIAKYEKGEGKKSITYINKNTGTFFAYPHYYLEPFREIGLKACKEFKDTTTRNFFDVTTNDIECNIYRMGDDERKALSVAIHEDNLKPLQEVSKVSRDARVLYLRYRLANADELQMESSDLKKGLKSYAEYRYQGQLQIDRNIPEDYEEKLKAGKKMEVFHPTLTDMLNEIDQLRSTGDDADKKLMNALEQFYKESEIYKILAS
jgi:hypothetical protein